MSEVMDDKAFMTAHVICANNHYDLEGERFTGADACVVLGNMSIDLREAIINQDCTLKLSVMCGALCLYVPQNVTLYVNTSVMSGEVVNRTVKYTSPTAPKMYLNIQCLMGRVTVNN